MSDFDLYILKKYLFIPLLVLCIPILGGPALQCRKPVASARGRFSKGRSTCGEGQGQVARSSLRDFLYRVTTYSSDRF